MVDSAQVVRMYLEGASRRKVLKEFSIGEVRFKKILKESNVQEDEVCRRGD